jgi:uncharacterized protein
MSHSRRCDFERLQETISRQFQLGSYSIHGLSHWQRVERNGLWLAARTGADVLVTRLFALLHDSRRMDDFTDPDHGRRGAKYARSLRGTLLDLDDSFFDALVYACTWHTDGDTSEDVTIGTCWDSDRLDLGRAGITPCEGFMSTAAGKEAALAGLFDSFLMGDQEA